jgi:cephalosporin-C deacetylase
LPRSGAPASTALLRWADEAPRPLVIHGYGYGYHTTPRWSWARAGLNVVGVDVRGSGRSRGALPSPSRWGYVLTGIESPERHVLLGWGYCG